MALEHCINANLLRKWIQSYREQVNSPSPSTLSAFAPVVSVTPSKWIEATFTVAFPNEVKLELQSVCWIDLSPLLNTLAVLPCSASSRD